MDVLGAEQQRQPGRFRYVVKGGDLVKFLQRLREPSSWAGLAALGALFGMSADQVQSLAGAGVAIAGALAVFLPEKPGK